MTWQVDPVHSQAVFAVRHMVVSTVRGHFDVIRGTLEFDEAHPENAAIEAEADVASINTRETNRDAPLRSADDFTMHGITRPVVFDVEYGGTIKDPYGMLRVGVNGHTKVKRKDWGLTYNPLLETGGAVVGEEVKIEFELEAVKPPVTAEA